MTPEQARHRADLLAALDGPDPADPTWPQITAQLLGDERLPRVERPRWRQVKAAEGDHDPLGCPPCRTRRHVLACEGNGCPCRCRTFLDFGGRLDPTAPDNGDRWVA
jgi:hypothetical protein